MLILVELNFVQLVNTMIGNGVKHLILGILDFISIWRLLCLFKYLKQDNRSKAQIFEAQLCGRGQSKRPMGGPRMYVILV